MLGGGGGSEMEVGFDRKFLNLFAFLGYDLEVIVLSN
jgi:hypothetical protein